MPQWQASLVDMKLRFLLFFFDRSKMLVPYASRRHPVYGFPISIQAQRASLSCNRYPRCDLVVIGEFLP